jgi:hypothetical protein
METAEQLPYSRNEVTGQETNLDCSKGKSPRKEQSAEGGKVEEETLQDRSPNWNDLMEENTIPEAQPCDQEEEEDGETGQAKEQVEGRDEVICEGLRVGKSERIMKQGLGGIKIADKAEIAIKKKNLEGNKINHKNSFAVLDSLVLSSKFSMMGGSTITSNLDNFDLLKELEIARHNMNERAQNLDGSPDKVSVENLPLEEMKYIEWKSDTSDSSDIEGFQKVSRRKKKRNKKSRSPIIDNKPKGNSVQPVVGADSFEGEKSRFSSRYYLRKGVPSHYKYSK